MQATRLEQPPGTRHRRSPALWVMSALWLAMMIITSSGCNSRNVAPEVPYESDQVEMIRHTIDEIDWSEYE